MTAGSPKLPRCVYEIKRKGELQLVEAVQVAELISHLLEASLDQDTATCTAYLHREARVTTDQWSIRWISKVKKQMTPP